MKPNRAQRRRMEKTEREQNKPKYSLVDVQKATNIALEMRKWSKGHLFSDTWKNKKFEPICTFCGLTMKTKKQCNFWFMTFLDRMQTVLINPTFFMDDNVKALWLQHDSDYQDVQIPLNMGKK